MVFKVEHALREVADILEVRKTYDIKFAFFFFVFNVLVQLFEVRSKGTPVFLKIKQSFLSINYFYAYLSIHQFPFIISVFFLSFPIHSFKSLPHDSAPR